MSFAPHTPEALLPRSDSKNPATTCKGITTNGRPCRRALGSSPGSSSLRNRGVLAVLHDEEDDGNAAAAYYCWQHKDQAERVAKSEKNHTELFPLQERTSIDTLVDRVGVMNLDEGDEPKESRHRRRKTRDGSSRTKTDLPVDWQRMEGPLMSVPTDMMGLAEPRKPERQTRPPRSNVKASFLCCVMDAGDDEQLPPRHRPHGTDTLPPNHMVELKQNNTTSTVRPPRPSPQSPTPVSRKPVPSTPDRKAAISTTHHNPSTPTRPNLATTPQSTRSQTQTLLSLIPPHLSPQTTSTLLTELSKPISPADASGYIYMFWLTPESAASRPSDAAASDLLLSPHDHPSRQRRTSDLLLQHSSASPPHPNPGGHPQTILLKIGRAENVHRRLNQWSKQCANNITLIRYYPYTPSRTATTPPGSGPPTPSLLLPRKVPHVHRVERLIHVELGEKRVVEGGKCGSCGREHREWFEVEASKGGLREVDEVVRRWVGWGEGLSDLE